MQPINDLLKKTNMNIKSQKQSGKEYTQMSSNNETQSNTNELQTFFYNGKNVRTIWKNGELWWVLKDVCDALEISNSGNITARLDDDEKGIHLMDTLGGIQKLTIINESGLYKIILRSDKPEAKKFQRWVTHEVLPSIRRHGAYISPRKVEEFMNDPDVLIEMLNAIKKERAEKELLRIQVENDKPKVIFADAVSTTKDTILIRDLAKILKGNGVDMGQNRLFKLLRQDGFLIKKDNSPTQKSMNLGLFELTETAILHNSGETTISKTPRVTGVGQLYFINYFLNRPEAGHDDFCSGKQQQRSSIVSDVDNSTLIHGGEDAAN
jgi:anti-repressor protein